MGIAKDDKIIIPAIYDFIQISPDNTFLVSLDGKHAYFDELGLMFLPFEDEYDSYGDFSEGLARIRCKKTGKWGYINRHGVEVITPQFYYANNFSNDMAIVGNEHNRHGAINKQGEIVIDYIYPHLLQFNGGFAKFGNFRKWGLVDKKGSVVVPQEFFQIEEVKNNTVVVRVTQGDYYKEGLLTIGGTVKWNDNMADTNIFIDKRKEFEANSELLIDILYTTGCPCAYQRIRNFIIWQEPIRFIDQELFFEKFKERLQKLEENLYSCKVCHTTYKQNWEQYSAFLWVLNVNIEKEGHFEERGAVVKDVIPVSLGFQGYELEKIKHKYLHTGNDAIISYLEEPANVIDSP